MKEIKCSNCPTMFKPKRRGKGVRYCSTKCRNQAWVKDNRLPAKEMREIRKFYTGKGSRVVDNE